MPICLPFRLILGTAEVLVRGSFPSVRSRAEGFYYGHPSTASGGCWRRSVREIAWVHQKAKKQLWQGVTSPVGCD